MAGNDEYPLRAFWGDRRETLDECAARVAMLLRRLASIDEAFRYWADPRRTTRRAGRQFVPTVEALRPVLERNWKRNRGTPEGRESLPFDVQLWNDALRVSVAIGGAAGLPTTMPNPNMVLRLADLLDAADLLHPVPARSKNSADG